MSLLVRLMEYVDCARSLGVGPGSALAIFWKETKNVRVRLGLARHHPDRVYDLETTYGRLFFRDNFGDVTNLVSLFHQDVYGFRSLEAEGAILDVGANIGLAAAGFARHNPGRPIYCFEPLGRNAELLALNCPAARIERVAVGSRSGSVELQVDRDDVMASDVPRERATRAESFEIISLDAYAVRAGIGDVALLKIDVEGMEAEVLEGAVDVLERTHEVVLEAHGPELLRKTTASLEGAGFRVSVSDRPDSETVMVRATRG